MNRLMLVLLATASLSLPRGIAADAPSPRNPAITSSFATGGTLEITECPVNALLDIYAKTAGLELVIASPVKQLGSKVIVLPERHGQDWGGGKFFKIME